MRLKPLGHPSRGTGARTHGGTDARAGVTIVEPCAIEAGVTIERSTIGPYASIEAGTVVRDSTMTNAIVGRNCRLERVRLDGALLGDDVVLEGLTGFASVGSHSEVRST